jgi:hypothetical protein
MRHGRRDPRVERVRGEPGNVREQAPNLGVLSSSRKRATPTRGAPSPAIAEHEQPRDYESIGESVEARAARHAGFSGVEWGAKALAAASSHGYDVWMKNAVRAKITVATREIADAETELERVLKEMRIGLRAEKTTVTAVVEAALDRVRTARAAVTGLESVLDDD